MEASCRVKVYQGQEETRSEGSESVRRKRLEELDFSLGGLSSGFVVKRANGELKKSGGIFARTWPNWLTAETAFNLELEWICLQDNNFVEVLSELYPEVKISVWQTGVILPPVEILFSSQWSKHMASGTNMHWNWSFCW